MSTEKTFLTASVSINAPIEKVWLRWTSPEDIQQWNSPGSGWVTSRVENDLRPGGRFLYVMESPAEGITFNFGGTYDDMITHSKISYTLDDGRTSTIVFEGDGPVMLTETFEPEASQPFGMQQEFCSGVLQTFKKYTEEKEG
ncbi:MAG TPA: SRPBCC domain-containing protein [Mucilaginibacter sp.]|nr:SRPBCC domain-containing protein [Mucilaginibacter sp.]